MLLLREVLLLERIRLPFLPRTLTTFLLNTWEALMPPVAWMLAQR